MKTIQEVLNKSAEYLAQKGIQRPRRTVEMFLGDILGLKRVELYMHFDRPLVDSELQRCREGLLRLAKREPVQYVVGEVEFYHCKLSVTPDVLIPRQETELLVDLIATYLSKQNLSNKQLWDVCCGSGCIGIALKKRFPNLKVILSDVSPAAIEVARLNAKKNDVEVEFLQGDLLQPFVDSSLKADFVVCNPPYVTEEEYATLDPEVRGFEPKIALVAQERGLEHYRCLSTRLKTLLNEEGRGWFELGAGQGQAVKEMFVSAGWPHCGFKSDLAGHDRFFFLETE